MGSLSVSAVVITCNSERFIAPCLGSLERQGYEDLEIIVVDNGSTDETRQIVQKRFPAALLIVNERNEGACRARNQGIQKARGEWILTLDCDIVLEDAFLEKLTGAILDLPQEAGAIQPKVIDAAGRTIYSFGIHAAPAARFYDRGQGRPDTGQFDGCRFIFGACSAAALYRRKALESIREETGFFDERFFFLVEDVDVAWRLDRRGWKTAFAPAAVCYHAGNSSGFSRQKRQLLCWRNRKLLMSKHAIRDPFSVLWYDAPRFLWMVITNSLFRRYLIDGTIKDQRE